MKKFTYEIELNARGSGKIIAAKVGVSPSAISQIRTGKKRPSPKLAKKLEEITGIPHDVWLYPEDFKNPFIKRKEGRKTKPATTKL